MIIVEQNLNEPPFFGAEVSGSFQFEVLNTIEEENETFFEIEIEGLTDNPFRFKINAEDAGSTENGPDPGDVFRFLMELLKKLICPHCL